MLNFITIRNVPGYVTLTLLKNQTEKKMSSKKRERDTSRNQKGSGR